MHASSLIRRLVMAGLLLAAAGCGRAQQIAPANRRAMQSLQTAVSSKKVDWLDASAKLIDEQRSKGEMSDAEFTALQAIVDRARQGDWDVAQKAAFALSEGQTPTAEDLERLKKRRPAGP